MGWRKGMFDPFPELKLTLRCDNIEYAEYIQAEDLIEDYSESYFPSGKPDFATYIRPVEKRPINEIEDLNGNHFIFGHLEALFQSDQSPYMIFPADCAKDIIVKVEHV